MNMQEFVDAVRNMRAIQKDHFHFKYSTFDKWEAEDLVDKLLKKL